MIFNKVKGRINSTTNLNRYLWFLVLAITVAGVNYSYSISMMLLTTFALAYLTKGSRYLKK